MQAKRQTSLRSPHRLLTLKYVYSRRPCTQSAAAFACLPVSLFRFRVLMQGMAAAIRPVQHLITHQWPQACLALRPRHTWEVPQETHATLPHKTAMLTGQLLHILRKHVVAVINGQGDVLVQVCCG